VKVVNSMTKEYFTLHQSIVDRDDLTIYEKMCCVVLARFAGKNEYEDLLSKDIIAMKMGCSNEKAYKAFEGLVRKGILESQEPIEVELNELELSPSNVIKTQTEESFEKVTFNTLAGVSNVIRDHEDKVQDDKPDEEPFNLFAEYKTSQAPKPTKEPELEPEPESEPVLESKPVSEPTQKTLTQIKEKFQPKIKYEPKVQPQPQPQREDVEIDIQVLRNLIDEVVSDKALRILLNIADGNIDLIRKKYAIAKASQLNDVIEVLMHELQRKTPEIKSVPLENIDTDTQEVVTQINQKRIADLYKKNKK